MSHAHLGLIIVAAGSSRRMGEVDKLWTKLGDRAVIWWSLEALGTACEKVVVVVRPDQFQQQRAREMPSQISVVPGGEQRSDSVRCGLERMEAVDIVAVHDAARPFVTRKLLDDGLQALGTASGAVPVVALNDTIKRVDEGGQVAETLNRERLRAIQTPQIFLREDLLEAYRRAPSAPGAVTDEALLLERAGYRVNTFPGDSKNFKITTPFDLQVARLLCGEATAGYCE